MARLSPIAGIRFFVAIGFACAATLPAYGSTLSEDQKCDQLCRRSLAEDFDEETRATLASCEAAIPCSRRPSIAELIQNLPVPTGMPPALPAIQMEFPELMPPEVTR
ncbi:MAG: hypothetical protein ABJE28_09360 [Qipengyuania citrea]|uniref:hypothetical protein n=1 Tax=Qipengyuania citrea TaxID=225971 RepID=UPI003265B7EE